MDGLVKEERKIEVVEKNRKMRGLEVSAVLGTIIQEVRLAKNSMFNYFYFFVC